MKTYEATETAYKNGYKKGYEDGFKEGYEGGYKVGFNADKWIPVTERLPEKWQNVLAFRTDGKVRFDFIGSLGVWYEDYNYVGEPVTHWMPLPEPPKED